MVRIPTAVIAALLLAACGTTEATPAAGPSGGKVSLQTPPYTGEATPSAPTSPPAVGPAAPAVSAQRPSTISSKFNPAQQHFIWVLPPGVHERAPWRFLVLVKVRGEVKHEATVTLKAERLPAGSRPEFPSGYEILRLTDDGTWASRTAEIDSVVARLKSEYGDGSGEVEMQSKLHIAIDQAHRRAYCVDGRTPDIRLYFEEDGKLTALDDGLPSLIVEAVKTACENRPDAT